MSAAPDTRSVLRTAGLHGGEGGPEGQLPFVWVNGRAMPAHAPQVSALDRGLTLADGVFETMRAYDGVIFRLERHLDRLERGTRALAITLPAETRGMIGDALAAARAAGRADASIRLTVTRGVGAPGLAPDPEAPPTVVVAVHALARPASARVTAGLAVRFASGRKNEYAMTAGLKTLAYTDAIAALLEARRSGLDDALFLDTAGHLSEATASNLFLVRGGALRTPPLSCGALAGVTRGAVLELAAALGLPAEERVLHPDDLLAADEAFLTSSLREIAPLTHVDGRAIGHGTSRAEGEGAGEGGPVTRQLIAAYTELVRRECGGAGEEGGRVA